MNKKYISTLHSYRIFIHTSVAQDLADNENCMLLHVIRLRCHMRAAKRCFKRLLKSVIVLISKLLIIIYQNQESSYVHYMCFDELLIPQFDTFVMINTISFLGIDVSKCDEITHFFTDR